MNNFLSGLNVSHTQFYDNHSIDFYLFRSLFDTRDIGTPSVNHIGAQFQQSEGRYVVREVVNGYPADKVGLRRGDVMLAAGESQFHPYHTFNPKAKDVRLTIERNGSIEHLVLNAVKENPNESFRKGMINSVSEFRRDNYVVGYVRLWSRTHPRILESFQTIMTNRLNDADAILLDLRGGYGGAWYEYLDPFFEDRSDYFDYSIVDRTGTTQIRAEPKTNKKYFTGPMVVLVNEGTLSGKEGLAYQFKKSGRALLVGSTTIGAFSAG